MIALLDEYDSSVSTQTPNLTNEALSGIACFKLGLDFKMISYTDIVPKEFIQSRNHSGRIGNFNL